MITKERRDEFFKLLDNNEFDLIRELFSEDEIRHMKRYNKAKYTQCPSMQKPMNIEYYYKPNVEPDEFLDSLDKK